MYFFITIIVLLLSDLIIINWYGFFWISLSYLYFINYYLKNEINYKFFYNYLVMYFLILLLHISLKKYIILGYLLYIINENKHYYLHSNILITMILFIIYFFFFYQYFFFSIDSLYIYIGLFIFFIFYNRDKFYEKNIS